MALICQARGRFLMEETPPVAFCQAPFVFERRPTGAAGAAPQLRSRRRELSRSAPADPARPSAARDGGRPLCALPLSSHPRAAAAFRCFKPCSRVAETGLCEGRVGITRQKKKKLNKHPNQTSNQSQNKMEIIMSHLVV